MADQQRNNDCRWTVETLREHLLGILAEREKRHTERFEAQEKALMIGFLGQKEAVNAAFSSQKDAVTAALASADRAVQKAEASAEKRFESVNEFRSTLADQQRNLIPRSEVGVMINSLTEKISALEKVIDKLEAERMGIKGGWGYAVGVAGFALVLVSIIGAIAALLARL